MIAKLHRFVAVFLIAAVLCLGAGQSVWAAPYGANNYSECTYQGDCPGTTAQSGSAPNTGLQRESLWFIIAGIVGLALVSFVVIRYLNIAKTKE